MTSALMEALLKDLRFAARQLRNNPVFAVTAIFVLALGMCASLAIFAFADAVLIKPLPYRNPGRLVAVYEVNIAFPKSNLSLMPTTWIGKAGTAFSTRWTFINRPVFFWRPRAARNRQEALASAADSLRRSASRRRWDAILSRAKTCHRRHMPRY
jgi:hypothetical protein